MFELMELLEVIPYFVVANVVCSFAFLYLGRVHAHRYEGAGGDHPFRFIPTIKLPSQVSHWGEVQEWLARLLRRKEGPDDDSAELLSSYAAMSHKLRRGGALWARTLDSPSVQLVHGTS
ncbi:hypothetical protein ACFO9Q_20015 [Paenibacillus sp. GCM10023252]|uniref:hypothetical protein n=1 Tax=Paenibacillus sp. GCM10023252 TaxID=3252649 RepID=UPI003607DC49